MSVRKSIFIFCKKKQKRFVLIFTFSAGWTASNLIEPWLVDGGGRAVQGLPAQGPARADGEVQ